MRATQQQVRNRSSFHLQQQQLAEGRLGMRCLHVAQHSFSWQAPPAGCCDRFVPSTLPVGNSQSRIVAADITFAMLGAVMLCWGVCA